MSLADDIRQYCKTKYVDPARKNGERIIAIRSGDVHSDLDYKNRFPLVCSAIGSNIFLQFCKVRRIAVEGPLNGVNTLFIFELL